MDLDTVDLRALLAVESARHFGRAAVDQGITQQGLSRRIARLERQIGLELVDRRDRRVVRLTLDGTRVAEAARRILAVLAEPPFPQQERTAATVVDVMSDMLATTAWVLQAERRGGVPVRSVQRPPGTTADTLVAGGGADFAFGRPGAVPRPRPPAVRSAPLVLEPVALLVPHGHPWARAEQLPFGALRGAELWFPMHAAPAEWRDWVDAFTAACGARVQQDGAAHGFEQWGRDVAAGTRPPSLVGEAMAPPVAKARLVPVVDPTPVFPWALFWSAERTADDAVRAFRAAIGFPGPAGSAAGCWMPEPDRAVWSEPGDAAHRPPRR